MSLGHIGSIKIICNAFYSKIIYNEFVFLVTVRHNLQLWSLGKNRRDDYALNLGALTYMGGTCLSHSTSGTSKKQGMHYQISLEQ